MTVEKQEGRILVRFPWKSDEKDFDPQQAIAELGETAKLTFRDETTRCWWKGRMFPAALWYRAGIQGI